MAPVLASIDWPEMFLPGTTDNFVSNSTVVKDLSAEEVWPLLADISKWETYYNNCSQITPPKSGPVLKKGDKFSFSTFGFPPLDSEVAEATPPTKDEAGRIAWRAWQEGDADSAVDVYHAWVIEDLPGNRCRILTEESQIGKPVAQLATKKPNTMLLGHQDWIEGLAKAAKGLKHDKTDSNLKAVGQQ